MYECVLVACIAFEPTESICNLHPFFTFSGLVLKKKNALPFSQSEVDNFSVCIMMMMTMTMTMMMTILIIIIIIITMIISNSYYSKSR